MTEALPPHNEELSLFLGVQGSRITHIVDAYARQAIAADRAIRAGDAAPDGVWQPIETARKYPNSRILLRWISGGSEWVCIGAWASSEDMPRLKMKGCPREGWMPDGGVCIPINQKDCAGWMQLPQALGAALQPTRVDKGEQS